MMRVGALLLCAALVVPARTASARVFPCPGGVCFTAGELDPTFGQGGAAWMSLGSIDSPGSSYTRGAQDMVIQADGKIVSFGSRTLDYLAYELALVRVDSEGNPDPSFGSGGTVITSLGGSPALGNALALQLDGKIVGAGQLRAPGNAAFLIRYNSDGGVDTSFGIGGTITSPVGGQAYEDVLVQEDGKILAVGYDGVAFLLERFNDDGSPDTSFGAGGTVTTSFGGFQAFGARGVALQPDGKIVAAGATQGGTYLGCALARYDSDGSLDTTFGDGGAVLPSYEPDSVCYIEAVAIQPDGKVVTAGQYTSPPPRTVKRYFELRRFNADGSPDKSFGRGGVVDTVVYRPYLANVTIVARTLAIQPDGLIVEGGVLGGGILAIVRHTPSGKRDRRFGRRGVVLTYHSSLEIVGALDGVQALRILGDGRILAAGNLNGEFGVARYFGSTCLLDATSGDLTCQ